MHDPQVNDYIELLKPRVMSLVIFTSLVGMVLAPGSFHPVLAMGSLLCIAIGAGASASLNMWWDRDIDAIMKRTENRPVPSGRVSGNGALAFGLGLSLASVSLLGLISNFTAAALLAFTIFFYAVIYTMWLKRSTTQNIVIGGAAGAFPPMVGWAASTGSVTIEPVVLFMIIFLWTPPHFWALALFRNTDYVRANVPMMPVVYGEAKTRLQIFIYTLILAPVALSPVYFGFGHTIYLIIAMIVNTLFIYHGWLVYRRVQATSLNDGYADEKRLFYISLVYLFALFAALLVEQILLSVGGGMQQFVMLIRS